jgi:catechol 2,3-dioxygenase-like lactoylglutathione lyase family enzyme
VRERGQWRLSDLQRAVVGVAVVAAVFLSAMSLGMQSIALLLVALLLLVLVGVVVFLLGLWYSGRRVIQSGTAYVIMSSPPPVGSIIGRCDLRLLIDQPEGGSRMIKLRDPAVPVTKWPRPGSVVPFEVDPRHPRVLRLRWDKLNANPPRPIDATASGPLPSFHTEFTEDATASLDATDDTYAGPTPPAGVPASPRVPKPGYQPAFLDPAMDLNRADPWPTAENGPPATASADPRGLTNPRGPTDPGDLSTPVTGSELPSRVPLQRPAEPVVEPNSDNGGGPGRGMFIMLKVADLGRSLVFYRDTLEFVVVDSGPDGTVLAYGGGRVLLCPEADMLPVDRRVIYLHIEVPDIDAAYEGLRAKGVRFAHKPRFFTRGDKLELWAARFRDPDGHGIALTQWRDRQDASRG